MPKRPEPRPKLTDEARHKRFVDMAREVEASTDPEDFEAAFRKVVRPENSKDSSGSGRK